MNLPKGKNMNSIKDVAQKAGVSISTVSRVLSNKPYVSDDVRDRVMQAVQELDYRPNQVARSLRSQQSTSLGLIVSDVCNPFFTDVSRAVEDCAYEKGYSVFLCNSDENEKKERFYLQEMIDKNVAGVILSPTQKASENFTGLNVNLPVVVYDRSVKGMDVDTILIDNRDSAFQLTNHLIENGYKRIAGIFCNVPTGYERRTGFEKAMTKANFDPPPIIMTQTRIEAGYEAAKKLLSQSPRPDALFTSDNLVLAGAMQAVNELGISVPEEIGLVGYDDVAWMTLVKPTMTIIRQPTDQIARMAVDLIMQRIENPKRPPLQVILKGQLVIRGSSVRGTGN
jgi:LacI family transcriptional regulator, fructose operon transcriptional repressor